MYAMVEIGGKQYKAQEGGLLRVERLPQEEGNTVEFDSVLMLRDDNKTTVGSPYVQGASVKAVVEGHDKERKIVVYKYKRRKRYHRKQGHRQPYSLLRVREISGAK
jgi:large subunit ribosomal protein L21